MLGSYGQVSTVQIVFFTLCLLFLFLILRHHVAQTRNAILGWSYLIVFSILRISGAALIIHAGNDSTLPSFLHDFKSAAIIASAGTTLLILGIQGILHEIVARYAFRSGFRTWHYFSFTILQLTSIIGMILTIIGGSHLSLTKANFPLSAYPLLKAGSLLLLHAYIGTIVLSIITLLRIKHLPRRGERRLFYGTLLVAPFVFVRLLYAILVVWVRNEAFAIILGNVKVYAVMAALMEFVIMVILIGFGLWVADRLGEEGVETGGDMGVGSANGGKHPEEGAVEWKREEMPAAPFVV